MRYPVNYIGITGGHHFGKCIDFGWNSNYGGQNVAIYSVEDGYVEDVILNDPKAGNQIFINHRNGIVSGYSHLSQVNVTKNQEVTKGQKIGNMGDTGSNANGCHLHFGLFDASTNERDYSPYSPFDYLEVYSGQTVSNGTNTNYGNLLLYREESTPSPLYRRYVYNVDDEGLNVRVRPNTTNGTVVDSVCFGKPVYVYEVSGSWSRIARHRWVSSNYLTATEPSAYAVNSSDGLNVRNKPSSSGTLLRTMPNGTIVGIFSRSGTWAKISPNSERWCSANYLNGICPLEYLYDQL